MNTSKKALLLTTVITLLTTPLLDAGNALAQETTTPAAAETPVTAATPANPAPTAQTTPAAPNSQEKEEKEKDSASENNANSGTGEVVVVAAEAAPETPTTQQSPPAEEVEEEVLMMPSIGGNSNDTEEPVTNEMPSVTAKAAPEGPATAASSNNDLETPDVVITGTLLERKVEDEPVRTQLVKREQLEQRKARNLYEALSYTSGVRVETNCQNCGFSQLRLNGLGGSYTQVLIDGLPSYSGLAGVYGLEQLPSEMIDRLEIVKGGGSALYGPSAVAGVVNLITRIPKENYATFVTSLDLINFKHPDIRITADSGLVSDDGKIGGHLFVSARRRNEVDLNDDVAKGYESPFSEITRLRQLAAGADLILKPVDQGTLKLGFHVIREFRRGGDNIDRPPHAVDIAEQLNTDRWQAEARWDQKINELINYSLGYIFAYTGRKSYYGGGGKDGLPKLKVGDVVKQDQVDQLEDYEEAVGAYGRTFNPLHVADAHLNFTYNAWGPQVVTVGSQLTYDDIDDGYVRIKKNIKQSTYDIGVYLQHDWIFADWGESVLGVRLDKHSNLDKPILSPRAALKFQPLDWLQLRTAFAMGFRAPQAFDEDLHVDTVAGNPVIVTNAPGLKPERSLSVAQQIGTDFHLPGGNVLEVGINGYFTRLQDAFDTEITGKGPDNTTFKTRINRGTTHVLGAELEAVFRSKLYAIRAGWTFEHARNTEPDGDINDAYGHIDDNGTPAKWNESNYANYHPLGEDGYLTKEEAEKYAHYIMRTPDNYGYIDAVFKYKGLQAQAGLTFTGPMLTPHADGFNEVNGEKVDGYLYIKRSKWFVVADANVSYAFPVMGHFLLEPFVGMRNIFNQYQPDYDYGDSRDSAYIYGPEQPRSLFFGIRGTM